jgi:hypothetical protein
MSIIQNKVINIFGRPGSWKTFLSSFFAYPYFMRNAKIFSNVDYFYKKSPFRINKKIQKITDIQYIEFQEKKWLIVIDEGWLNINSRRSISSQNMEFAEMLFLWRKKNCDIIFIAQLDYSLDRYMRDLANANIYMESYPIWKNKLNFTLKIKKWDYTIWYKEIDLITFANESQFNYSTLESSKIDKKEKPKKEKNLLTNWNIIYNEDVISKELN